MSRTKKKENKRDNYICNAKTIPLWHLVLAEHQLQHALLFKFQLRLLRKKSRPQSHYSCFWTLVLFSRVSNGPREPRSSLKAGSRSVIEFFLYFQLQKLRKYKIRNYGNPRRGSGWVFAASTVRSCTSSAPNFPRRSSRHHGNHGGEISTLCKWFCIYVRLMILFISGLFAHAFWAFFHDVHWQMFRWFSCFSRKNIQKLHF